MAKNSKKIIALTAAAGAVGAVAATLAACFTKYRKNKNNIFTSQLIINNIKRNIILSL